MNKQTELQLLKEQKEKAIKDFDKQIEAIEAELNDKWRNGHWFPTLYGDSLLSFTVAPELSQIEFGLAFTTKENCEKFIEYQKAMVRVKNACKDYLTEAHIKAYIPCVEHVGKAAYNGAVTGFPKYLWVNNKEKALEIALNHIEDLKIIQNFTWEE